MNILNVVNIFSIVVNTTVTFIFMRKMFRFKKIFYYLEKMTDKIDDLFAIENGLVKKDDENLVMRDRIKNSVRIGEYERLVGKSSSEKEVDAMDVEKLKKNYERYENILTRQMTDSFIG